MQGFYEHECGCGCGHLIEKKETHRWDGIPKYVLGHYIRIKNPMSDLEIRPKAGNEKSGSDNYRWYGGHPDWWARELKKIYKECVLCKSTDNLQMHHKDHNTKNNKRHNQIIICATCHNFWHQYDRWYN